MGRWATISSCRRCLLLASLLIVPIAHASRSTNPGRIPTSGSYRALVVFARFADDVQEYASAAPAARAWSHPDSLPDFAHRLLSNSAAPPFDERSLTDYFFQQSNHRFVLYGDVYPSVVTVSVESEYTPSHGRTNIVPLSKDILHKVNSDPGFDLSAYDDNEDGFIDHVFIIMRKICRSCFFGGAAGFSALGYSSGRPEFGRDASHLKRVDSFSGSYARYNSWGIVLPELDLVRLMAHEFGHNFFPLVKEHIRPIGDANGVPEGESYRIGYALMVGRLQEKMADARGDYTISAYERELLGDGWIDCDTLKSSQSAIRIADLYSGSSANCYKVLIPESPDRTRTIYLSNRQRIGFFDRKHSDNGLPWYEAGLQTTGLLVTATQSARSLRDASFAVVPADNTLALNDSAYTYEGDLFGPDTKVQLTPWTRPNVAAYTSFPEDLPVVEAHFQAIDNIRYSGGPAKEMAFDYVADFRQQPVIREDSWIGSETSGFEFTADMLVTNGSTLTIDTDILIASTLTIETGSKVVVNGQLTMAESSALRMDSGSWLTGGGLLIQHGAYDAAPDARCDFPGVVANEGFSDTPQQFELKQNYPNPFNPTTTITYALPRASDVTLTVFDITGRRVRLLLAGRRPAGSHDVRFDASGLSSGVYVYRLEAADFVESRRLVVAK